MNFNKKGLQHLIPIVLFLAITSVFFAPLYSGKTLVQSDNIQLTGVNKEVAEYREKGEPVRWNSREFSGVPLQTSSEYNPFGLLNRILYYGIFPKAVMMVFTLFLGFYLLSLVMGVSKWMSAIGAFAFAFSTFNIISIEAGHDNKVLAIAFMAPVLAGIILAYRGQFLKGGVITLLAAGFQLYYGHIQITYYLLIMVLAYLVVVVYEVFHTKKWKEFIKASGVLALMTVVAFGCNFGKLYSTLEYSDYSTRGGSELTAAQGEKASSDGLDKDYALQWSNGVLETFTVMFPYFHGGATGESLDNDSQTHEALTARGVDRQTINNVVNNLPLYWGDQPFTAGPIYFGVVVILFFILSLTVVRGPFKWWGIVLTVLSLMLAMGRNLEWFTDLFFYYVPLYNKFRSVTMIVSIAQLIVPLFAVIAADRIISAQGSIPNKVLFRTLIIIGGIGVFFLLFKGAFFDFSGPNDSRYGFPEWLINAIVQDRKSLFTSDILRGLFLVALVGAGIWLYQTGRLKTPHFIIGLGVLIFMDLWLVNKRYLDADDFKTERRMKEQAFTPSGASQRILQDEGYFRVLNVTGNPFADGITSYHHYSIGGYSAIKMQRYQELYDHHLSAMNRKVLNMLNTRYIIANGQNNQPIAQQNPEALGNVWLVEELIVVGTADEELAGLSDFEPATQAIVDDRFTGVLSEKRQFIGTGSITLEKYHPEEMVYRFESSDRQFAVFSEIYYKPGWQAYLDGQEVAHVRVNYVLRGMEIPAGTHEIIFKYEPLSSGAGNKIILASTVILLLLTGFGVFQSLRSAVSGMEK